MKDAQIKFLEILKSCKLEHANASLILDINGMEKIQGLVSEINENNSEITITLDSGFTFSLDQIIAINGYFDPLYSMC